MNEVAAFIALTAALALARLWRRDVCRALAFGFVAAGLCLMAAIQDHAGGIIAFATWTLVSYLLLNFPAASVLFLFSAFCYILELYGVWVLQIQIASNLAGVIGLAAIWYGRPKWNHRLAWGAGGRFSGTVAAYASASDTRHESRKDAP